MKKAMKLYKVHLGIIEEDGNDCANWSSKTVVAVDALEAVKKARLAKFEYAEAVELIARIDVA